MWSGEKTAMGFWVLTLITLAVIFLVNALKPTEEQEFESHKRRLEAMSPADCRLTIDRMFAEAHIVVRQPKYVSLNWDAVREVQGRQRRLVYRLRSHFKV
jgi:hypothetical protein